MDFREFSKQYNDYLMHAGDRDRDGHILATQRGMERKKTAKGDAAVRNWFNRVFPDKDFESFWDKVSKRDYDNLVKAVIAKDNHTGMTIVYKYLP